MAATGTDTPRERYRAQVRAEITQRAWEQIATAGASALSLNAIAKQMGMSGLGCSTGTSPVATI